MKIRPILADRCYKCHSTQSEKLRGNLHLDSREGLLRGGERGPVIVPGDPEKSRLIKAIRYTDEDLQMPPTGKLPAEVVADFEAWVKLGAPYPAGDSHLTVAAPLKEKETTQVVTRRVAEAEAGSKEPNSPPGRSERPVGKVRQHWAFQLPREVSLPKVKDKKWPKNPIDSFILARLEEKGLRPSPPADKRTLIRRATFDMTGLPPTPEEVDEFLRDSSPNAFAKVVDRLLTSPRYGERWGRYWLDLARYADTKGYVFTAEHRFPYSYTYRDWVIRAFNDDLPYDQFLIQQIAADLLPLGEDKRPLAAMGFLTLGRRFLNNIHDIIDDRIDVVARTTMGLTVACARCHDHKYDPIPSRDYYSLYGVFANSPESKDPPRIGDSVMPEETPLYLRELKRLEQVIARFLENRHKELVRDLRSPMKIGAYLMAAHRVRPDEDEHTALSEKERINSFMLERWKKFLDQKRELRDPIFSLWHALAALPEEEFAIKAEGVIRSVTVAATIGSDGGEEGHRSVHPLIARALAEKPLESLREVADRYATVLSLCDAPSTFTDPDQESLRQLLFSPEFPPNVGLEQVESIFNRADRDQLTKLRKKIDQLKATHPGVPPSAMALEEAPQPTNPRIFLRGNPKNLGGEVPRQFLACLSGVDRQPFKQGSGRLELAQAIASKDNPLTARVIVNRVWLNHFGAGLVRTPSDFGLRSEAPSHPELLDYLALRFVENGWSIKKLHRLILLSSVYQQSSQDNLASRRVDQDNTFLWRMNRQRLDFEALRDSLLAVSGRLDTTMGGRAADLISQPFTARRTVYGFIDRQNLPNMFRVFDFATPDTHSPQRYSTTVPQQALFMMNSPFVVEQARNMIRRLEPGQEQAERRIQRLYQILYGRSATPQEVSLGVQLLQREESQPEEAVLQKPSAWLYGIGHYEDTTRRVKNFQPLSVFTGDAWQGNAQLPDSKLGLAALRADGGYPGNNLEQAVIRRWVAPFDATATIRGTLSHRKNEGDGIRARVVSSRSGELVSWEAPGIEADTRIEGVEVKQGDTIDFVVDCRSNPEADSFRWAPVILLTKRTPDSEQGNEKEAMEWNAANDFSGPPARPLTAWEKYAQVLLLANEFVFID